MKHASLISVLTVWAAVPLAAIALILLRVNRVPLPPAIVEDKTQISTDLRAIASPAPFTTNPAPALKPTVFYPVQVGEGPWSSLKSKFGENQAQAILKLNRIDRKQLRKGYKLMVTDSAADTVTPFPTEVEMVRSIPKLILVSRKTQAFGAYESGRLIRWGPTSTGKKSTQTPTGLYHTNWKAKKTRSTVNSTWVLPWTFNLDNFEGIAFHQYELPGYPASHGCVRLLEEDARWVYGWADMWVLSTKDRSFLAHGTPVLIFGDYDWEQQAPWKRLASDPNAASVSVTEIGDALISHMPTIEARRQARDRLVFSITGLVAARF